MRRRVNETQYLFEGALLKRMEYDMNQYEYISILETACRKVIKMNRQHAKDQFGDANIAESWSCVVVLRKALAKPAPPILIKNSELNQKPFNAPAPHE